MCLNENWYTHLIFTFMNEKLIYSMETIKVYKYNVDIMDDYIWVTITR